MEDQPARASRKKRLALFYALRKSAWPVCDRKGICERCDGAALQAGEEAFNLFRCPWLGRVWAQELYIWERFTEARAQHFYRPGPDWPIWVRQGVEYLLSLEASEQEAKASDARGAEMLGQFMPEASKW